MNKSEVTLLGPGGAVVVVSVEQQESGGEISIRIDGDSERLDLRQEVVSLAEAGETLEHWKVERAHPAEWAPPWDP